VYLARAHNCRHIVQRRMIGTVPSTGSLAGAPVDWANAAALEAHPERVPLKERCSQNLRDGALPSELLATYLRYARRFANPSLSSGARRRIKDFYLNRHRCSHEVDGKTKVTPRQLEALIRLSEARARAELRRVVLRSDVEDVIEIIEAGSEIETSLPGEPVRKGKTKPNMLMDRLRQHMERQVRSGATRLFRERELFNYLRDACGDIKEQDFNVALHKLHETENVLLLKSSGTYEFVG